MLPGFGRVACQRGACQRDSQRIVKDLQYGGPGGLAEGVRLPVYGKRAVWGQPSFQVWLLRAFRHADHAQTLERLVHSLRWGGLQQYEWLGRGSFPDH